VTATVGLIANPAAGRDIRRLVGLASVVPNHEKVAVVRRVLAGLVAAGVAEVLYLPDPAGIVRAALDGVAPGLRARALEMAIDGTAEDSTLAARLLAAAGVGAIVTFGGDGTNRAVAAGSGDVPLVAISTGTNNVFPTMIDGTVAGLAAGRVATGAVDRRHVVKQAKVVQVVADGILEFALVDAAVCLDRFVGARAIWDPSRILAIVLARTEPWAVGLSSIGGQLSPVGVDEPAGLYVEIGSGPSVRAVIAPGLVLEVPIRSYRRLALEETVELPVAGTIALDGERELYSTGRARAWVAARGPAVVDIRAALANGGRDG
jgi:predicted polyphosphate/ATP-dependent NAD kinase